MRALLDDALLDQAADVESGTYLQDKVRYLQRSLEKLGQGEMAWSEVPTEELTKPPSSFSELMERLDELRHVVLGDDRDPALELDEQDILGTCAAKAWTALLALDDYAEARLQGDFEQGVHAYFKQTPSGYRSYSANSHAPGESDSVKNNPKYRNARVFGVPTSICADGEVYMD